MLGAGCSPKLLMENQMGKKNMEIEMGTRTLSLFTLGALGGAPHHRLEVALHEASTNGCSNPSANAESLII